MNKMNFLSDFYLSTVQKYERRFGPRIVKYMKVIVIGSIAFEVVEVGVVYYLYRKLSDDQDFRHKFHTNFPRLLGYYYSACEKLGDTDLRKIDATKWETD